MKNAICKKWFLVLLISLPFFTNCASYPSAYVNESSAEIYAMNTLISLTVWGQDGKEAILDCENFIYQIEDKFSTTREDSELYQLSQAEGSQWVDLSLAVAEVLEYSLRLAEQTQGNFDPTIYPLVKAWGFTQDSHRVPSQAEIDSLLPLVDSSQVELDMENLRAMLPTGMELDFGAVAKGYVADELTDFLRDQGFNTAMISLGGNIYAMGKKTDGSLWNIGIQNPYGGGAIVSVQVEDKAVVTSGGYQRYFTDNGETYWHIIDPSTGYPAKTGLASVSIISDSAKYGDCLSTALFVMGLEDSIAFWREYQDFEAVFVTENEEIFITSNLAHAVASGYEATVIY